MKKISYILLFFIFSKLLAQSPAPDKINYQGVARDASGNAVTTLFDIHFIIRDNGNNNVHDEIQTGIQPNAFGIFSTQIGLVTPISPTVTWQSGPYSLSVSIKTGSTFTTIGTQQLASVPFALYAQKAGNALPTATINGSTLRWDQASAKWKTDTNIINTGLRVNIGNRNLVPNNKFVSVTANGSDSAAVFGFHKAASDGMAGVRGFASGNSSATSTLNTTGILGGHFLGFNLAGQGIGVLGQGYSGSNNGVGVIAIGSSNGSSIGGSYAVGLYATTDPTCTTQNRLAGVFDRGNVFIRDTLQLDVPGSVGQVLTRWTNGKAIWQTPGANTGPFTATANYIHATPSFTNNRIVFGIPYPVAGFGYGSRVSIVNASSSQDTSLVVSQLNSVKPAIYSESFGSGFALYAKNKAGATAIYAITNAAGTTTNPAIFGEAAGSSNNNAGVYGLSNSSSGVKGFSQNLYGVWGESNNNTGVFGLSTGGGQAGRFLLQGTSSANNAVYIATNSTPSALKAEAFNTGAAIEAKHSNSAAGSSNTALLLNDGHFAATGTNINSTCFSTSSAATTVTATKQTGSNDVRGEVIGFLSPPVTINPGQLITVSVSFDKQYLAGIPHVMTEAMNVETATLSRYISGGNGSGFTVTFKNTGPSGIGANAIHFKYFVIE
jgi:hypothetical protein